MAQNPLKLGATTSKMAIDPLKLGMAIVESAQSGSKQGRERAFSEFKAMEAGYNRAAIEMDARIRAEQAKFQYEVLMPLELAKKQAEVEYSRAKARMLQESQLTDTVTLSQQEMQDNNVLQSAAILPQIIEGTSKAINELDNLIKQNEDIVASLPADTAITGINTSRNIHQKQKEYYTAQRDELIKQKENMIGLNSAVGAKLHKIQKSINSILSAPIGTSTKSAELKRSALIRGQLLQQTIDNLASINPEALRSYNMSVAMEYIDLLENQEQKDKYMLRIVDRATPLTPEQAKIIYEQVSATKTATISKGADFKSMDDVLKNIKLVEGIIKNLRLTQLIYPENKETDTLISQAESTQKYLYSQLASFRGETGQPSTLTSPQSVTAIPSQQQQATQTTLDEKERMQRMRSKPIGQFITEGISMAQSPTPTPLPTSSPQPTPLPTSSSQSPQQTAQPASDEEEMMKGRRSEPIGQSIKEGASDWGRGILNLGNAALDGLTEIVGTIAVDPIVGMLPWNRERLMNDLNQAIRFLGDYNNGQMTRDELKKSFDDMFKPMSQINHSITSATLLLTQARPPITQLPFSDLELNMLRSLKSKDALVSAFFDAREQLSPQTKNDIMDITVLVNRKLRNEAITKSDTQFVPITTEELVKQLLSKIQE